MEAHAALAKCYIKLGMTDEAESHLKKYIESADKLLKKTAEVFIISNN